MSLDAHLHDQLSTLASKLALVTERRMFGSQAFFTKQKIFALVWDGRIGLKLPDPAAHARLLAMAGAERWAPGGSSMGAWLLVPESFHDDDELLAEWVKQAHAQVLALPDKPLKPAKAKKKR